MSTFCTMQFKQVKLTKVKFHCSQVNMLNKIYTQKQNGTKFHCQSLHMANTLQKRGSNKKKGMQWMKCSSQQAMESRFSMRFCKNSSGRSQVPRIWRNHVQSISQRSNTSLRSPQLSQNPPTEYVMS